MQNITLDMRDVDKIDIQRQGRPLPPAPARQLLGPTRRDAYQSAIGLWERFHGPAPLYRYPAEVSERPPYVNLMRAPTSVPVGLTPAARAAATIAVGLSTAMFAYVGVSSAVGLYGSTTREFGAFYGGSLGLWSSVGISTGPQYTFVFGGPSDFGGVSWGVGCDVDAGPFGIGGMLLFTLPPIRLMGYCVAFSVGTPSPPVTLTVQVGMTMTKPLLVLR